jgi:hypothetical protein
MTAVAGATFTAAQFNTFVRDNLNETAPAKATAASQMFVSTGPNTIATRVPAQASISTAETLTALTGYTNLATPGPAVTVVTGTIAIVAFAVSMSVATNNSAATASVQVSGASTVAASDTWAVNADGLTANNYVRWGLTHVFSGLTPGTNTFTVQYKAGSSNTTYRFREISVIPL